MSTPASSPLAPAAPPPVDSTLFSLLAARRAELQQRLERTESPADAGRAVDRALAEVREAYVRQHTVDMARVAHALLQALSGGVLAMAAPTAATLRGPAPGGLAGGTTAAAWAQILLTAVQLGACVALLVAPLNPPMVMWAVVLGLAILLGIELLVLLWRAVAGRREARLVASAFGAGAAATHTPTVDVTARLDAKHVCDRLADALGLIDQALAQRAADAPRGPKPTALTDHRDLLEWLQRLLGAAGASDGQEALSLARQARQLLIPHGVQAVDLDGAGARDRGELFDAEPDVTGRLLAPVTLLPALVRGDDVLLRGRVIEPGTFGHAPHALGGGAA